MLHLFRAASTVKRSEPAALVPLIVGGRSVAVELRRDARARRVTLRADAVRGCLRIALPARARLSEAGALISAHRDWIGAQVARWPVPLPFAPGAVVPFDGGTLTLDWQAGRPRGIVRDDNRLLIGGDPATLPGRVTRWLKAAALADMTLATRALALQLGKRLESVRVGDPAARWGSCASAGGRIAYSWRLILAPPAVRHSVVAHEAAHLVHANHGADFWRLAAELNGGDPAPQRRWLKAHGAGLHWIGRDA